MPEKLMIFMVVYHDQFKEYTTNIIASNRLEASEMVDGDVMHVCEGSPIRAGFSFGGSGWAKSFSKPQYSEPSEEWKSYLKSIHLNQGLED